METFEQDFVLEDGGFSFNSLQTGRHVETTVGLGVHVEKIVFQFPSNGKARGNESSVERIYHEGRFQFPSNGKARGNCYW